MLTNWPLIAIRIAENFLFVLIIIGSIIAAIIPVAVAAGLSRFDLKNAENPAAAVANPHRACPLAGLDATCVAK